MKLRLPSLLFVAAVLLAAPWRAAAAPPPDAALHALFEREFEVQLDEYPEQATYYGEDGRDARLTDLSPAAVARRKAHAAALLRELQRIDPKRLKHPQSRLSREMMIADLRLEAQVEALYGDLPFEGIGGWQVVGPNGGPHSAMAELAKAMPTRTLHDAEHWLARLDALPHHLEQQTMLMRAGLRSGWLPPRAVMSRVAAEFDPFVAGAPEASPLYVPFAAIPPDVPAAERERVQAAGRELILRRVQPAYAKMQRFLVEEYIPACPEAIAASALPGGMAYYALVVRNATTLEMTPRAIHDLGLAEVARIGRAMDALVAQSGFAGTRAAYAASLRADPAQYYARGEDMLRDYRDIAKRVDAELPKFFAELPRTPYGVRAMDAYEGDKAEYYIAGAIDGGRAGIFTANTHSLATRPKYEMENIFLHEAVPGHHLQAARAQEIAGLPRFRRTAGYVAYDEGWALYAESLGTALGLYTSVPTRFAALAWEMVRAARLVVDTGVHALGWTREQAIDYMVDNAGIDRAFATTEVDRYIDDPGQALGYKLGELKIHALRAQAQAALGESFDIRRFHNALLDDGALPLPLLEARIGEWIAVERARAKRPRP
jgi:uncharacterized protein (DUF885 family)